MGQDTSSRLISLAASRVQREGTGARRPSLLPLNARTVLLERTASSKALGAPRGASRALRAVMVLHSERPTPPPATSARKESTGSTCAPRRASSAGRAGWGGSRGLKAQPCALFARGESLETPPRQSASRPGARTAQSESTTSSKASMQKKSALDVCRESTAAR